MESRVICPECDLTFDSADQVYQHSAQKHYWDNFSDLFIQDYLIANDKCAICSCEISTYDKYVEHIGAGHKLIQQFMTLDLVAKYLTLKQNCISEISKHESDVPEHSNSDFNETMCQMNDQLTKEEQIQPQNLKTEIEDESQFSPSIKNVDESLIPILNTDVDFNFESESPMESNDSNSTTQANTKKNYNCPECFINCGSQLKMYCHSAVVHHSQNLEKLYDQGYMMTSDKKCLECLNVVIDDKFSYFKHVGGKHKTIDRFIKSHLLESYKNPAHRNQNIYKCPECPKLFSYVSNLYAHSASSHHSDNLRKLYEEGFMISDARSCDSCSKIAFKTVNTYITHVGGKHKMIHRFLQPQILEKYKLLNNSPKQNSVYQNVIKCPECENFYQFASHLYKHSAKTHHSKSLEILYEQKFMINEDRTCNLCPNFSIFDFNTFVTHCGVKHKLFFKFLKTELIEKYCNLSIQIQPKPSSELENYVNLSTQNQPNPSSEDYTMVNEDDSILPSGESCKDETNFKPIKETKQIQCPDCDKTFDFISHLHRHSVFAHYREHLEIPFSNRFKMTDAGMCTHCPTIRIDSRQSYFNHIGVTHKLIYKYMSAEILSKYKSFPQKKQKKKKLQKIIHMDDNK